MHAHIDGVKLEGYPSSYFAINGGMTPRDKSNIIACVAKGFSVEEIWRFVLQLLQRHITKTYRSEFAPRGMTLERFKHNWQKIEAIVVYVLKLAAFPYQVPTNLIL